MKKCLMEAALMAISAGIPDSPASCKKKFVEEAADNAKGSSKPSLQIFTS